MTTSINPCENSLAINKDLAIAIGRYIIGMQRHVKMLQAELTTYEPNASSPPATPQHPAMTRGDLDPENHTSEVAASQRAGLLLNIAAENQDSGLIRVLHDYFLKSNVLEE
jgi:hypothetical protein